MTDRSDGQPETQETRKDTATTDATGRPAVAHAERTGAQGERTGQADHPADHAASATSAEDAEAPQNVADAEGEEDAEEAAAAQEEQEEEAGVAAQEGAGPRVLGIVADPDMPTQVGSNLAAELTNWLNEHAGGEWTIEVLSDPITAGEGDRADLFAALQDYQSHRGWEYTICVTDLPLLLQQRPLIADVDPSRQVGVVSLPALGGLQPHRRMRHMLRQLLEELLTEGHHQPSSTSRHRLYSWLTNLTAPVHRTTLSEATGVRYTATRWGGWFRLLSGMVRTNRPWRLIFGMSSALAAAIATSAFGLSSSTIWQIADALSPAKEVLAAAASVALLVVWLITAHSLWERSKHRAQDFRRLARLYNSSTVLTLTIGVTCLYLGLLITNTAVAAFLIPPSVLTSTLQAPVTPDTYFNLAWGFTTMGIIAGALGSSLESDRAVRQAAYGYREEQRRNHSSR
ncbi:hypothetical protein GCM10027174_31730 [Salinifilum aidingensis]